MTEAAFPAAIDVKLSDAELARLEPFGRREQVASGTVLFAEGDRPIDFIVVLEGAVEVSRHTHEGQALLRTMGPREFLGDVSALNGQGAVAHAQACAPSQVLRIAHANLQRLMVEDSGLSDLIVSTFVARRAFLRTQSHAGIAVVGRRYDRQAFEIRDLLDKNNVPHHWLDADDDPETSGILAAAGVGRDALPVIVDGRGALVQPTLADVAERLGLTLLPDADEIVDVVVVGAGPAGLAASVYAGSEGLSVATLEARAPGGQAGTSSKIENYLGFPTGVSGRDLAERASVQAQKFGARLAAPLSALSLTREDDVYRISCGGDRGVRGRAVVIATGAQYRKLPIEGLERFEGSGVFYGATAMEAQLCSGQDVVVVGAGNSAGQGAVFLSQTACNVHVMYRRADIRDTMSDYLVRRLEATPNIHLHPRTEISALQGCEARLRRVALSVGGDSRETMDAAFVFLFIGAAPCTDWLPPSIALDAKGFVHTGGALTPRDLVAAGWTLERMPTAYETSLPRVYAVGDVRAGSVKRVASAVGEGSVVVQAIHAALHDEAAAPSAA